MRKLFLYVQIAVFLIIVSLKRRILLLNILKTIILCYISNLKTFCSSTSLYKNGCKRAAIAKQ